MKKPITIKPIGIIHTPYKEPKGIPIQGKFEASGHQALREALRQP